MHHHHKDLPLATNRSSWTNLVLVFLLVVLGAFLGQLAASILCFSDTRDVEAAVHTTLLQKRSLLILQAMTASSAFIIAPLFYLYIFERQGIRKLFQWRQPYTVPMLITLGLVPAFMVANTWFIQWNMAIKLPDWLEVFEIRIQEKEAALRSITILFTSFHSLAELGMGFLVISLIPAIGEELLFRGLVQNICHKLTNNIHVAIGISAFLFSAMHLQFYSFVPRFLLGALFGYIYWWTKDLFFPMVAHLFNNTAILLALFLHQQGMIAQDISTPQALPGSILLFFAALVIFLARLLQRQIKSVD